MEVSIGIDPGYRYVGVVAAGIDEDGVSKPLACAVINLRGRVIAYTTVTCSASAR